MSTILQDMMGMLSRKEEVTPVTTDYITIARKGGAGQSLMPFPKTHTKLVTLAKLATLFDANDTFVTSAAFVEATQVLTLTRNDAATVVVDLTVAPSYLKTDAIIRGKEDITGANGDTWIIANETGSMANVAYTGTTGSYIINLPSAAHASWINREFTFAADATILATFEAVITADGSEKIDGAATYTLDVAYETVTLWSDGVHWRILAAT